MSKPKLSQLISALAVTLLIGSPATAQDINLCEGLVTHNQPVVVPQMSKPPLLQFYLDPAFGSRTIRISNSQPGEINKPPYSTMQAWNADESLLLLYRQGNSGSGHYLLDGHTYRPRKKLNISPADLEEVFWSHSDPNTLFYVSRSKGNQGKFYRHNVARNKSKLIKNFSRFCPGKPTSGNGVHMQSLDDDLFGFRCRGKSKKQYKMFTYRISTDETNIADIGEGTQWRAWTAPIPAPSGKRIYFQGTTLDLSLNSITHKHDMAKHGEHSNTGLTHDGQDAIFQVVFDPSPGGCNGDRYKGVGHLTEFNLETGKCRPIINEADGYPYPTSGTHISAQAYHRPGWVAMSSIGYPKQFKYLTNNQPATPLFSEIYLVNTDPENEVLCRLAHHRTHGKKAKSGLYKGYFGEPHVTISPSGTRLIFGSDWYDSGAVDSYVIELPAYRPPGS